MNHDISAAKARAASGMKPLVPQAGDPSMLEQEVAIRALQEQTARLREVRLAKEAAIRAADKRAT